MPTEPDINCLFLKITATKPLPKSHDSGEKNKVKLTIKI